MAESFDIVLSKPLTRDNLAEAFLDLIPPGLRVDVRQEMTELPNQPGAIWALVASTDDSAWPCVLNVLACSDECNLGSYPDLRVAGHLWERFGTDALCGTYPFVGDVNPHDPYWSLACVDGRWHLASTCGTRLMGPYTDGVREFPDKETVRLIRPVEVPDQALQQCPLVNRWLVDGLGQ